ncbi:MAG: hypothetical protein Q8P54_00005, partial [bacterium]|nr:hypothetical protein [bacterium]
MPNETIDIATRFVDLALKYNWWEIEKLPPSEVQVFFEAVSAASFKPKKIVLGKLVGHYLDQDGSRTSKTYSINDLCPFKVLSEDGTDHYSATGWLDEMLKHAVRGPERGDLEKLIEVISEKIEQSVSLAPIQLTPEGDSLSEYPPSTHAKYLVKHSRDEDSLGSCVGIHEFCKGWMDRCGATKTHDAIVCRGCSLRVLFPKETKTYGDLR